MEDRKLFSFSLSLVSEPLIFNSVFLFRPSFVRRHLLTLTVWPDYQMIWTIYNNINLPQSIKNRQSLFNSVQNTKWALKFCCKTQNFLSKWQNFARSGHTAHSPLCQDWKHAKSHVTFDTEGDLTKARTSISCLKNALRDMVSSKMSQ